MSGARLVVLVAAVLTAGVTARLGVWQLDRAAQKTALQASLDVLQCRLLLASFRRLGWDVTALRLEVAERLRELQPTGQGHSGPAL